MKSTEFSLALQPEAVVDMSGPVDFSSHDKQLMSTLLSDNTLSLVKKRFAVEAILVECDMMQVRC